MTILCTRCGCAMLGGAVNRERDALVYHCACCPHVVFVEASQADIEAAAALPANVVPFSRERRAAGSK